MIAFYDACILYKHRSPLGIQRCNLSSQIPEQAHHDPRYPQDWMI